MFICLDNLESRLNSKRFLLGNRITEADWRLFPTLVRFDSVYYSHFKTNKRRIIDYPSIYNYTCELFQQPGIKDTVNFEVSLQKLEKIIERLENGDISLEDSVKSFEEGIGLVKECQKQLSQAELKVKKLLDSGDTVDLDS